MKNAHIVTLVLLLISLTTYSKKDNLNLECRVTETPKGNIKEQKKWSFQAGFLKFEDKKKTHLESRYLKDLVIEAYSSWSWAEKEKGQRHKELTAHIEIREKGKEGKATAFASGGNYETSKNIFLATIFSRQNNDAISVICGN